jgi:CheY-like chemotaxis protein
MTEWADTPLRGCRVLIVEDDYFVAADLAEALQELGAFVLGPIGSLNDALQLVSKSEPRIAVLDINLGQDQVYPFADALQARGVPFIFVTGYSGSVIPDNYRHIPRCQKPVQAVVVARLLAQQLDRRPMQRS